MVVEQVGEGACCPLIRRELPKLPPVTDQGAEQIEPVMVPPVIG
jgi:hypothetical protein